MTKKQRLLAYSVFIFVIFLLAYLGLIPTELNAIPYYDSAGHFVLYGLWGYFFGSAYEKPIVSVRKFHIQKGIAIAASIAIVEEALQNLSPLRTFSLFDLAYGLLGIALACAVLNFRKN